MCRELLLEQRFCTARPWPLRAVLRRVAQADHRAAVGAVILASPRGAGQGIGSGVVTNRRIIATAGRQKCEGQEQSDSSQHGVPFVRSPESHTHHVPKTGKSLGGACAARTVDDFPVMVIG